MKQWAIGFELDEEGISLVRRESLDRAMANNKKVKAPFANYIDAKLRPVDRVTGEFSGYSIDDIRDMQDAIIEQLDDFVAGKAELDSEVAMDIMIAITELRSGHSPDLLRKDPVVKDRPIFKALKQDAVNYLLAVKKKLISDSSPKKTVADAFGVERRTVLNWEQDKSITVTLGKLRDPEKIKRRMNNSGLQFKRFKKELTKNLG